MIEGFNPTIPTTSTAPSFYSNSVISGAAAKDPKKVAGLFEAIFYRAMLQIISEESEDDPLLGSSQMGHVQSMYHDELANQMGSMGHLGIKDLLANEMVSKMPPSAGTIKPWS